MDQLKQVRDRIADRISEKKSMPLVEQIRYEQYLAHLYKIAVKSQQTSQWPLLKECFKECYYYYRSADSYFIRRSEDEMTILLYIYDEFDAVLKTLK
jgi:hypothetical protein